MQILAYVCGFTNGLCVWFANGLCAWLQLAYVFLLFAVYFLHNFAYEITLFNYHAMLD